MGGFKEEFTLEQRKSKAQLELRRYPTKIPVIIQNQPNSKLPNLPNAKFLCQKDYKFGRLQATITKMITAKACQQRQSNSSISLFTSGRLPAPQQTFGELYQKYKSEDGFIYITYGEMEAY